MDNKSQNQNNNKKNSQNNNNNNNNNKGGNNGKNGQSVLWFALAALLVLFVWSSVYQRSATATTEEITYTEFKEMVRNGEVESVIIGSTELEIEPVAEDDEDTAAKTYYTANLSDRNLYSFLDAYGVDYSGETESTWSSVVSVLVSVFLPIVLIWVLLAFFMRRMGSGGAGGGIMGVGKSNAKIYVEKSTGVTFADVAGQEEAKESLQEVVEFLHNPQKYTQIGAKLPKGALLVGPPGTGKTLLAKAVAGEAKVPFFSIAGSGFVEMFVGVGASRVRDLFREAEKNAPCIIFIDEIDAIGKSRDSVYGGGNDEREQTLNQLLAEMDGFDSSKGVLILAATNRPEILDKALLRPGRFDRRIIVDKPDLKGRLETLKVHAKNVHMDETVDFEEIALATAGCVGSDLANMINEAAINAVKNGRKAVNQADLFESVEVVLAGKEKKDRVMGPKEKKLVAYHEVGHALASALMKDSEPVQKITIVPRTMGSLGYTLQTPEEEKYLQTKAELEARIITYMAGRAAEEITSDSVTTGAANDIEMATKIARAMVTQMGMSSHFGMMGLESVESRYLDGRPVKNCGDDTIAEVDDVVKGMLHTAYEIAKQMLIDQRLTLERIAEYLYEHETITGKEFMQIFHEMNPEGCETKAYDTDLEKPFQASWDPNGQTKAAGTQTAQDEIKEQEQAPQSGQTEEERKRQAQTPQEERDVRTGFSFGGEALPDDAFEE